MDGLKKGTIVGKGAINNRMTNILMRRREEKGVPTHYVEELSDRETAVKKVSIVPLEFPSPAIMYIAFSLCCLNHRYSKGVSVIS